MLRVGLAGIGFMGWIHYLAYQRAGIPVAGFCTRDAAKRSGDWTSIQGNFGPPGEHIDVSAMVVHDSIGELIADDAIDVIDVCLPPHLHAAAIEQSLAAGKKVVCEKPLALDGVTADRLAASAGEGNLAVAHILPYLSGYRSLVEAASDHRYGRLQSMRLKRFISPPDWIPDFYDRDRVGGPLIDLHVHDSHLVAMLMGQPDDVTVSAIDRDGIPKRYETLMRFDDGRYVSSGGGVIESPARPFTHGFEAIFDDAVMQYEMAAYRDGTTAEIPLIVLKRDGGIERPVTGDPDPVSGFADQLRTVIDGFGTGQLPVGLRADTAASAIRLAERQMTQ